MEGRARARSGDAKVQYEMAETYDDLHLPYDAVTYFKRALEIYPKATIILNGMAIAQMHVNDDAGAAETFARCLAYDSEDYACTNDLGRSTSIKSATRGAQELLRAHDLSPEGPGSARQSRLPVPTSEATGGTRQNITPKRSTFGRTRRMRT